MQVQCRGRENRNDETNSDVHVWLLAKVETPTTQTFASSSQHRVHSDKMLGKFDFFVRAFKRLVSRTVAVTT